MLPFLESRSIIHALRMLPNNSLMLINTKFVLIYFFKNYFVPTKVIYCQSVFKVNLRLDFYNAKWEYDIYF